MIETINWFIGITFVLSLFIGLILRKDSLAVTGFTLSVLYLTYDMGFQLAKKDFLSAIINAVVLLLVLARIAWVSKQIEEESRTEVRTYSREELIIAKKIYDSNYLANPEDFEDIKGTYEDAQVSIDYLLGIIDADSKKYKKVMYGTRKAES
ncbi:hypothetical protein IIF7_19154 [Zunongwangia atlantica 22II14-10F7]|uniref:Uncharacterized protein n=2 Tax=Zunongwangia TaxID=417127 RepID=A0A1Y1SYF5_9FLAO|nr:hypothetical protein IIF7_19154 [Zunongwangia atlantica 22II14-10F7]